MSEWFILHRHRVVLSRSERLCLGTGSAATRAEQQPAGKVELAGMRAGGDDESRGKGR